MPPLRVKQQTLSGSARVPPKSAHELPASGPNRTRPGQQPWVVFLLDLPLWHATRQKLHVALTRQI